MVQNEQITFYTHPYSPFCHGVHIALEKAEADYTSVSIDVTEKPEWYSSKINTVTGKHPPEEPSPEATVLVESNVIVELLAETFPSANLLPHDAILRAQARIFISILYGFLMGGPASDLLAGLEALQARLPPHGFAVGEWSIADIAAGPLLVRILLLLANELGKYPVREGKKTLEALRGPKFARIMKYIEDVKERPSFQATWDEAATLDVWKTNPAIQRV